jgi:hypothetical protein
MAPTRREFLKIAGFSAVGLVIPSLRSLPSAQAGTPAVVDLSPAAPRPLAALTAKRWAMTVEPRKCRPDCTDCITACHAEHNVPAIENPKDDIYWIGLEKLGHRSRSFPSRFSATTARTRPACGSVRRRRPSRGRMGS